MGLFMFAYLLLQMAETDLELPKAQSKEILLLLYVSVSEFVMLENATPQPWSDQFLIKKIIHNKPN